MTNPDPEAFIDEHARAVHTLLRAYMRAGFERQEAFTLVLNAVTDANAENAITTAMQGTITNQIKGWGN